ncbi:uncharacterized protein METZ01_LOCUS216331, partial [marine metagenome]
MKKIIFIIMLFFSFSVNAENTFSDCDYDYNNNWDCVDVTEDVGMSAIILMPRFGKQFNLRSI